MLVLSKQTSTGQGTAWGWPRLALAGLPSWSRACAEYDHVYPAWHTSHTIPHIAYLSPPPPRDGFRLCDTGGDPFVEQPLHPLLLISPVVDLVLFPISQGRTNLPGLSVNRSRSFPTVPGVHPLFGHPRLAPHFLRDEPLLTCGFTRSHSWRADHPAPSLSLGGRV